MKAVLMSIRPQWCNKIFNGSKTIEVRKSRPSIDMPFKVYVYQTRLKVNKGDSFMVVDALNENLGCGKVIGSFVCDRIDEFDSEWSEYAYACAPTDIPCTMPMSEENAIKICKEKGCMTLEDIIDYFGDEEWRAYFWHITEPKLFEKPRELGEFCVPCKKYNDSELHCMEWDCEHYSFFSCANGDTEEECLCNGNKPLRRPPQSWVYCETIDER